MRHRVRTSFSGQLLTTIVAINIDVGIIVRGTADTVISTLCIHFVLFRQQRMLSFLSSVDLVVATFSTCRM